MSKRGRPPETEAYRYETPEGYPAYTSLTPEQQLETQRLYMMGQSANLIGQKMEVHPQTITRFIENSGLADEHGLVTSDALREQYHQFRSQQLAIAAERIMKWRELGERLLRLVSNTLDEWEEKPPKSMTVTGMSRLLEQFRKTDHDWLKLLEIDMGATQHRLRITREEEPRQTITARDLLDQGISLDQVETLIEITDTMRATKALPVGEGDTDSSAAPDAD